MMDVGGILAGNSVNLNFANGGDITIHTQGTFSQLELNFDF